jgi:hypothetical protein
MTVGVHVSEIHTDVRSSEGAEHGGQDGAGKGSGETVDQRWRESRGRTEWLSRRVAAEGFDD